MSHYVEMPDIVCITETWVSEGFCGDRLQDFELPGYNMFEYCRESRQGGGVLLYVNSLYRAMKIEDPLKDKTVESIWVDVKLCSMINSKLRIGAFYRPGNLLRTPQMDIDHIICDEIRRNFAPNCIIMGDFNLKNYEVRERETIECVMYRQLFEEELFMHQFVTEPTRDHSILDLVFSDNNELIKEVTIAEGLGSSDHNAVKFNISSEVKPRDNLLKVPNFNQANFESMRNELNQIDWNNELAALDACTAWDLFKAILNRIQSKYVPMKHKRSRRKQNLPWLTPDVRNAIKKKRKSFNVYKRSLLEENKNIY